VKRIKAAKDNFILGEVDDVMQVCLYNWRQAQGAGGFGHGKGMGKGRVSSSMLKTAPYSEDTWRIGWWCACRT
jgi:hypothetical protein